MAKYRPLSLQELQGMEDEFVMYLVTNGITVDQWLSTKEKDKDIAQGIIDSFSEVVWEGILSKNIYIDLYEPQTIYAYHCTDQQLHLVGMTTRDRSYDFTTSQSIRRAQNDPPEDLETFAVSKAYSIRREEEIYALIRRGGQISQGQLYRSLKGITIKNN